ncbi:MAG: LPS export ABC transporter periplasmic protein LptC [Pseudomonadota bacterium]
MQTQPMTDPAIAHDNAPPIWRPQRFTPRIGGRFDKTLHVLRLLLPTLAAVLLLVTLAYPLFRDQEMSFVLARNTIEASEDRLRMINPRYSGVDTTGRPFEVRAQSAVQPRGVADAVSLTGIAADMTLDDDARVDIEAQTGEYRTSTEVLNLTGPVSLTTTSGYRIQAGTTRVDLDDHIVESQAKVNAKGPLGAFQADGFSSQIDADSLIFEGNVVARITPERVRLSVTPLDDDGAAVE